MSRARIFGVRSANPIASDIVSTPYGPAVQDASAAAMQARLQIQQGAAVYKGGVFGGSETGASQFLATESPLNPGYAGRYGIPPANANFDFILKSAVRPGAPVVTCFAPGEAKGDILLFLLQEVVGGSKIAAWRGRQGHRWAGFATMCSIAVTRREEVFHKNEDYVAFLDLVEEAGERLPMRVLAWCLIPNHFHLVLWPHGDGDLSRWMQWLLTSHVRRYHRHYHSSGHVWQGRFKAFPIEEDEHLWTVLRYVERNALRANLSGASRGVALVLGGGPGRRQAGGAVGRWSGAAKRGLAEIGSTAAKRGGVGSVAEVRRARHALRERVVATRDGGAIRLRSEHSSAWSASSIGGKVECPPLSPL